MVCEEEHESVDRKLYRCKALSMDLNSTRSHSNQVNCSCHGYYIRRECSKAQMCLQKILHIISSNPRHESREDFQIGKLKLDGKACGGGGFCIDCNLRLGEKSSEGECEVENVKCSESAPETKTNEQEVEREREIREDYEVSTEKILKVPQISDFLVQNGDVESNPTDEKSKNEELIGPETASYRGVKYESGGDCLGLLIEAARLILGDFEKNENESTHEDDELNSESKTKELSQPELMISGGSKRKVEESWMVMNIVADMEDRSPVVRSKRGRSQVLPCRYRDSVLEPLASKISRKQRRSRN